jgi:hypothetical protein
MLGISVASKRHQPDRQREGVHSCASMVISRARKGKKA